MESYSVVKGMFNMQLLLYMILVGGQPAVEGHEAAYLVRSNPPYAGQELIEPDIACKHTKLLHVN
jgi:hypothetical protein